MKKRDLISSVIWMALGALFAVAAFNAGLTLKGKPGPGFLPFLTGIALAGVSLFVLIPALLRKEEESADSNAPAGGTKKVIFALAALFAWAAALDFVGYLITTFLFMVFATRLMEPRKWWVSILIALLASVVSYLLFSVLLEVQLPKGLLSFL
ncbi:MAG: tripartite tricarboxylate transporter TctB family protein [Treponemataceae bacterium]